MMNHDLSERTAVVTGASKGIGAATVRLLADHGARVAFCARGQEAVDELSSYQPTAGTGSVHGYMADMADATSTQAFLEAADADHGPADILVNNVGASPSRNFLYMSTPKPSSSATHEVCRWAATAPPKRSRTASCSCAPKLRATSTAPASPSTVVLPVMSENA